MFSGNDQILPTVTFSKDDLRDVRAGDVVAAYGDIYRAEIYPLLDGEDCASCDLNSLNSCSEVECLHDIIYKKIKG